MADAIQLNHICRGSGKIFAVVSLADELKGCQLTAVSHTASGELMPSKLLDYADGKVLVVPVLNVVQNVEIRACDEKGKLLASTTTRFTPRGAKLQSQINTFTKDSVIATTRNYDLRPLPGDCFVQVDRFINTIDRSDIIQGSAVLTGNSAEELAGDYKVHVLDLQGHEALQDEWVCMRDTVQEYPDFPGNYRRSIQFSCRIDATLPACIIWFEPLREGLPVGLRCLEGFVAADYRGRWQSMTCNAFFAPNYAWWYQMNHEADEVTLKLQSTAKLAIEPSFSVIVPLYNTPDTFFCEMVDSVLKQSYCKLELVLVNASPENADLAKLVAAYAAADERVVVVNLDDNRGITENTNEGIKVATGDFVCFLDHDDTLALDALYCYAQAINDYPETDLLYSDEDHLKEGEYCNPYFKPDWDPILLEGMNYVCHFLCVRKSVLDTLELPTKEYDGSQDHHMALRIGERARNVYHARRILYHWRIHPGSTANNTGAKPYAIEAGRKAVESHARRVGIPGEVVISPRADGRYEILPDIQGNPLVSIIVPTKDNIDMLDRCISSVLEKSSYQNFELILVENNSCDEATFAYYDEVVTRDPRIRVERYEGGFNYSLINNFGAEKAKGDYLLLLNNDTEVITPDWMERMLSYAMRKDVGAVGVKLLYPDNTVQHSGVFATPEGPAHTNRYLERKSGGYVETNRLARCSSAVTAACLMTRREAFEAVGGLDPIFEVDYNDVAFCYALWEKGYRVVLNPAVELYHYESISRGFHPSRESELRFARERGSLRERYPRYFAFADPFCNPNLAPTAYFNLS